MLVDINLLPKRSKKSRFILYTILLFLVASILGSALFMIEINRLYDQLEMKDQELEMTITLRQIEEQKLAELNSSSDIQQLRSMVAWVKEVPISTVSVLNHLTALLPERGYFLDYNYTDNGNISIQVQFDSLYEVSSYLHHINQSEWIENVYLNHVDTTLFSSDAMPRYIARYSISLDRAAVYVKQKEEL